MGAAAASAAPLTEGSRVIDTRVLGRPDMYYGEREKWKDWSFVFRVYMMAVDPEYANTFERIERSDVAMYNASLSPRTKKLSMQLYYVIAMLSRAKAQDKINVVPEGEGCVAWQRFLADYDPKVKTRRVGMLLQILRAAFTGDMAQALDQFDRMIKEYEECCEDTATCPSCAHSFRKKFDEHLKAGLVVANMADKDVQQHVLKSFGRLDTFEKIKDEVLELTRATQYLNTQARPMELGGLPTRPPGQRGRDPKGSGKGKDECFYCGKPGHQAKTPKRKQQI